MTAKGNPLAKPDPVTLEIKRLAALIERKDYAKAEAGARSLLQAHPKRPDVHSILGLAFLRQKRLPHAIPHFEFAVKTEPTNTYYLSNLGRLYLDMQFVELALPFLNRALAIDPKLTAALLAIGKYYTEVGKAELAVPYFERLHKLVPQDNAIKWHLAASLDSCGRTADAKALYQELRRVDSHAIVAMRYFSRNGAPEGNAALITEIEQLMQKPGLIDKQRGVLHNALGFLYEKEADYPTAFAHFDKANQLRAVTFNIEKYRAWVDDVIRVFTPDFVREHSRIGNPSTLPVLIVGMPRSGTTLTEQVIANHGQAAGAGELARIVRTAAGLSYNPRHAMTNFIAALDAAGETKLRGAADNYIKLLKFHSPEALRVVDKMPHNFECLGLVALLWPNARVIHCMRNPADICLSCFQQGLSDQHAYSKDLTHLGLYYREYKRLMDHWKAVLPLNIYELSYETFTSDFEGEARKVIEFIGLPWDEACLKFHEAGRTVRTFSRQQVRNPIYRSSVERWRHYEKELQPLLTALGNLA